MDLFTFDHDDTHRGTVHSQQRTAGAPVFTDGGEAMDISVPAVTHEPHVGTPSIPISSPLPKRSTGNQAQQAQKAPEKLDFALVAKKAQKKKKKKALARGAPAPASTTVRGFQTPATSGGEESDMSVANTPRFGPTSRFPSVTGSPALRPTSAGGISSLKQQLEALNIGSRPRFDMPNMAKSGISSTISVCGLDSPADSDKTEMESYEVNFENDFISSEVPSKTSTFTSNRLERIDSSTYIRKMSAEDFEPLTCLGKGSFGTVLLVKQRVTGRLFAQKQFRKASMTVHKKLIEQTKTERAILESVNRHPFVVKLFYAFQDHEKLYLILEYAQGGELFHHLATERMFSEDVSAFYMAEMVLALYHLHRTVGVVYRDLKPENCLLDSEGHLLLTDFGLSKVAVDEDAKCNSFLGTIEYMAPEVIQGVEYGMAVDWWSLGALGVDLMTGNPPFTGNNNAKIQEKIVKQKLALPYYLSADAKDLLARLLRKDPKKRLGSNMPKDLAIIKAHRFFRKIDWKKLEARELVPPIAPLITDPELAENFDTDFTDLPLSPVTTKKPFDGFMMTDGTNTMGEEQTSMCEEQNMSGEETNPFGGFSYVASSSFFEGGDWEY